MKYSIKFLFVLTLIFTAGCLEEFEDLEYSLLEDESQTLIDVTGSSVFFNPPVGTGSIDITFQIEGRYDEFSPQQQADITSIFVVTTNNTVRGSAEPTATSIVAKGNEVFEDVCYYFVYVNKAGEYTRKTTKNYCFSF